MSPSFTVDSLIYRQGPQPSRPVPHRPEMTFDMKERDRLRRVSSGPDTDDDAGHQADGSESPGSSRDTNDRSSPPDSAALDSIFGNKATPSAFNKCLPFPNAKKSDRNASMFHRNLGRFMGMSPTGLPTSMPHHHHNHGEFGGVSGPGSCPYCLPTSSGPACMPPGFGYFPSGFHPHHAGHSMLMDRGLNMDPAIGAMYSSAMAAAAMGLPAPRGMDMSPPALCGPRSGHSRHQHSPTSQPSHTDHQRTGYMTSPGSKHSIPDTASARQRYMAMSEYHIYIGPL